MEKIRDNTIRLGMKAGYDLFPRGLKGRLQRERKKKWAESQNQLINEAQTKVNDFEKLQESTDEKSKTDKEKEISKKMLEDLKMRVEQLRSLASSTWEDLGPVYDCIVFHDGSDFRAVVDVDESGNLSSLPCMTDYRKEYQYSTFKTNDACLNFAVNIYDEGRMLSIVNRCGCAWHTCFRHSGCKLSKCTRNKRYCTRCSNRWYSNWRYTFRLHGNWDWTNSRINCCYTK